MRIAVIDRDKCTREVCGYQCIKVCPGVRMGDETVSKDAEGWPVINEELCTGCGLCVKRCPVKAIKVINLPEEKGAPVFQYGPNAFRLYGLLLPKQGSIVGVIGVNGIGKTTALELLRGALKPNFGKAEAAGWEEIKRAFRGNEVRGYLEKLERGEARVSAKQQYVDRLASDEGEKTVEKFLADGNGGKSANAALARELAEELELGPCMKRKLSQLSGGELQRAAIAKCLSADAGVFFIDEPASFLDVRQRLKAAAAIRKAGGRGAVVVVEHDLAVLDYLSDYVHVLYGTRGVYGKVSGLKAARNGVNEFLDGFLKDENVRMRKEPIRFEVRRPGAHNAPAAIAYGKLVKKYPGFGLAADGGSVREGEVVGILGPNATGKTTFIKMLAGVEEPDEGSAPAKIAVAYKPQYLKADFEGTVRELFAKTEVDEFTFGEAKAKLELDELMEKQVAKLSGGELQRVAIAICLSRKAGLRLFDEPSAFLDVEQRLAAAELIKKTAKASGVPSFVVDHDILFIDLASDRVMVFSGNPGIKGSASAPTDLREGMNSFLAGQGITFRRDPDSRRPRANKPGSQLDVEQKKTGEYYYAGK
ncbi:MAG: ribosome biogenesis/translation initiation ATPase RLI [Candidatus Micrarchaeota archaeon]|nr:ribosome biogenesis/translation initiation ATPase RLI [Candidatus Micrarchaeota archaeon]